MFQIMVMKKIIYIANARIPTEKAHGNTIMKMCEAFARAGNEVELMIPRRFNTLKKDPYYCYSVWKDWFLYTGLLFFQ